MLLVTAMYIRWCCVAAGMQRVHSMLAAKDHIIIESELYRSFHN